MVSRISFGILIFTALLAISFRFKAGQMVFLADSSLSWLIGVGIALGALALLFAGKTFHHKQLMALGVLYAITPLSVCSNPTTGFRFIILQDHLGIALGLWAIASLAWSMFFFKTRNLETQTPTNNQ